MSPNWYDYGFHRRQIEREAQNMPLIGMSYRRGVKVDWLFFAVIAIIGFAAYFGV